MNILIDMRALQSGTISGVEVFVTNLVASLCEEFPQVRFFLWTNARKKPIQNFPEFPYSNAVRFHTSFPNNLLLLGAQFARRPALDRWLRRKAIKKGILRKDADFDVCLVPDPRPTPISVRGKKVMAIHDLTMLHFPKNFSVKTRLWHRLLNIKKEISESSRIVTPSRFTKEDIVSCLAVPPEKITVVGGGVSEMFRPITDSVELDTVLRKYNLPDQFFLTLSTLEPRKNISNLIEAFGRFKKKHVPKNCALVIAGKMNPRIFRKISLPKQSAVIFPGFIAEADKAKILSAALGFIFPSEFEGFGLPVLEAMACGTPVASSYLTSLPEVYGDAALPFDPHNKAEIAEVLETLYLKKSVREELAWKGLERANTPQFSWATVARKTMSVLEEVGGK